MAFLLAQAGTTLYKVDLATGTATALTLPTGVTLSSTRKPKFAILNQWVAMVNSPTINLVIDPEGTVRPMVPRPPSHPPSMAAGAGTGLTGAYQYLTSFVVLDTDGNLLMESPLSPPSDPTTLANQNASLTDIDKSLDTITARRLYRGLSGGVYPNVFRLMDVLGNVATSLIENVADSKLTLLPALSDTLVAPPGTLPGIRLKNIVEWKSRLWAVADDPNLVDTVYATETNKVYAWPNSLVAYPTGLDKEGIIGFAVLKNQLGFLKRNGLWMISGSSGSTGINIENVSVQQVVTPGNGGCMSADTIVTIRDKAYWLGRDGVYEWDGSAVHNISNDQVYPWFTTDTYFNRTRFSNAFARFNELSSQYELHLAAAGSSVEDRWVSFNIDNRSWYGPHKTDAFTPSHAALAINSDGLPVTLVGGTDGIIYTGNSSNKRDGSATAIDMDCYGPFHATDAPDIEHFWGQLSMLTRVEAAGTLTVTPYVGRLNAVAQAAITHDLTLGRELLRILGDGPLCRLRIRKNTVNQSATILGYEISPVFENGRR